MKCLGFLAILLVISLPGFSTGYRTKSGNDVRVTFDLFKIFFILSPIEEKRNILNEFLLEDFVDFTKMPEFQEYIPLAGEVFGKLYDNLSISLNDCFDSEHEYEIEKNEITFRNVTTFSTFFKSYNSHINNLKFQFSSFVKNDVLFDSLRGNGAYLKRLHMEFGKYWHYELFNGITFPIVDELIFKYCEIGEQTIDLQQIFPSVRRLIIKSTEYSSWFDKLLVNPQLSHLHVDIGPKWNFPEEKTIKILENNRQIKHLGFYNATPHLLEHINAHHQQIVSLQLQAVSTEFRGVNDIYMQSVTKFSYDGIIHFYVPLTFSNLKELQWQSYPEKITDDGLLDFIEKHKETIESLVIDKTRLNETHFEKMQHLKELKKISLNYEGETEALEKLNRLIKLVRTNPKLAVIQFMGAQQNEKLIADFKASGLKGWINSFEPLSRDEGVISFIKKTRF